MSLVKSLTLEQQLLLYEKAKNKGYLRPGMTASTIGGMLVDCTDEQLKAILNT